MNSSSQMDLYQLTSLVPHEDAGISELPVTMCFFARGLPRDHQRGPCRAYLLWAGLRRCMEWMKEARFEGAFLEALLRHPSLGPALQKRPKLVQKLERWRFHGVVESPAEGRAIWAGPAVEQNGHLLEVAGVHPSAYTPFLQVQTDLLTAKLIETPLVSIINHMTMVASKAARVVKAAGARPVLEFGTRRTHPDAAIDAAYAAYVAGVAGTSNIEAYYRYGIPALGTMDHFAVQAWERDGVPRGETEKAYFKAFYETYPQGSTLLVDTYDTFGAHTGIRAAVEATGGKLAGIRIDSDVTRETLFKARALLDELGAPQAKIVVSNGMDESEIWALGDAPVDSFGIGERIVTSPDAPVGVGAVGKLCEVDGRPSMKLSRGSGKATLPGRVQVFRKDGVDTVACADEKLPGEPLLQKVWEGSEPLIWPKLEESRARARSEAEAFADLDARFVQMPVSEAMVERVRAAVKASQVEDDPE